MRWLALLLISLLGACERPTLPMDAPPTIQAAIAATATAAARVPTPRPSATPRPVATLTRAPLNTRVPVVVPTPTPVVATDVSEADYLETWRAIRLEVRASLNRLGQWYPWVGSNEVDHEVALLARAHEYGLWQSYAPRLRRVNPPEKLQALHGHHLAALDYLATAGRGFLAAESPRSDPFIAATGEQSGNDAYAAFLAAIDRSEAGLRDLGLETIGPAS